MEPHPRIPGESICRPCWRRAQDRREREEFAAQFLAGAQAWALDECLKAGMSRREVRAELGKVPVEIRRAIPSADVKAMLAGAMPAHGFGIGGDGTGAGKTSAMAAIFRECVLNHAVEEVKAGRAVPATWLAWEAWPSAVSWMRSNATSDAFPGFVNHLCSAPVLFLDDLGSERIKGTYVEDFAASQLDWIIDERYRNERPIFYTTNLDTTGLVAFYGARLVSRLCGDNPLCFVSNLPDQRFAR